MLFVPDLHPFPLISSALEETSGSDDEWRPPDEEETKGKEDEWLSSHEGTSIFHIVIQLKGREL